MADPDFLLAKILQAKFDKEAESVRKKNSESGPAKRPTHLVSDSSYKGSPPKKLKSSSLVDPEWEIIDPTPDIHTLFITFNKRFFWGALESVEVRWSPRMYSCAGLCSYEGRRGMCSVRLSEPLLKLRPRSDLVETLLHEMIHAYLFVTHNNRDRTGHGPEFHKHMYRINNEAGTNITVYHSFHDEVKLYKKHWWRCDGPCQFRPPFMGLVKRAMNRAPGPYDSWWTTHQATCGGTFIKVREPTNTKFKQVQPNMSGNLTKATGKDIRNFFNTPGNSQGSSSLPKSSVSSTNSNFKKPSASSQSSVVSKPNGFPTNRPNGSALTGFKGQNVFGIGSSNVNGVSQGVKKPVPGSSNSVQGVNRVVGFGDLNSQSTNPNSNPTRNLFGGSGQKLGGGNGTGSNSQLGKPNSNPTRNLFGGSGQKLGGNSTGLSSQSAKPTSFGGSGQKLGGTGTGNPWKANTNRIGGALMNRGGGTMVITAKGTAKDSKMTQSDKTTEDTKSFVPFNGQGQKLGCASVGTLNSSASVLRLSGANSKTNSAVTGRDRINSAPEFSNRNNPSGSSCVKDSKPSTSRRGSSASLYSGSPVKTELEASFNNSAVTISDEEFADVADFVDYDKDVDDNGEDDVHCPVCNMSLKRDDMVMHLENCDALKTTMDNINNSSRPDYDDDDDVVEVSEENSPTSQLIKENDESGNAPIFPCPCCSKYFTESQINKHLDECLSLLALQEFGNTF